MRRLEGCPSGSSTGCSTGTHPEEYRRAWVLHSKPQGIESAGFPRDPGLPGSSDHLAVDANDGVRKNTTRGVRVSESSAKANSSDLLRYRSERRWQHRRTRRDCDQPARHHRKVMQPDEESSDSREIGSRAHRNWTRHGARFTDPREIVDKERMERTRLRRYASAERR